MRRHRARLVAVSGALTLGVAVLSCVDLFHGTDFATLCAASPDDPACNADAGDGREASTIDAGDAARTPPDFCQWTANEARVEALRACAWLGACEGPLGESAFGPCVVRAQLAFNCAATPSLRPRGAVAAFWGCLATVASCGDVDDCVFPGGLQTCVAVSGSSSACGSVPANSAVRLECAGPAGRATAVEPCIMLGKTCSAETPSTATCSGSEGLDCTTSGCSGASAVDCTIAGQRTLDRGVDCSGYGGGTCVSAGAGMSCAPDDSAATCTGEDEPSCSGAVLTSCANGKATRVDCGAIGLPCDDSQPIARHDLTAACVNRSAGACNVADTCSSGSLLQSCGRGATFTVDCAKLGFAGCRLDAAGRASCAAPTN